METNLEGDVDAIYNEIDEDFRIRIEDVNKKKRFNSKLSLVGIVSTALTAIPSLSKVGLTLEEMKYFITASVGGLVYSYYSNRYRNEHLKETQLLVSGPYSIHRNPEYVGDMLVGASVGAAIVYAHYGAGNFITAALALLTMGFMARGVNLTIERDDLKLEQRFGEKFREYKKSVPKYIPKISNLFKYFLRNTH
jgi:protein-S-isoprenylcysteine O-methyltransferase Ste14